MAFLGRNKSKAKSEGGIKERLLEIETTREGCDELEGSFDDKTGLCQIKQIIDPDKPDTVTHKKFDEVKRPERMTGVETVESTQP